MSRYVIRTSDSVDKTLVTIHMKVIEKYFPVVLFTMLCKVVLSFESVDESVTTKMKAIEKCIPAVLFMQDGSKF